MMEKMKPNGRSWDKKRIIFGVFGCCVNALSPPPSFLPITLLHWTQASPNLFNPSSIFTFPCLRLSVRLPIFFYICKSKIAFLQEILSNNPLGSCDLGKLLLLGVSVVQCNGIIGSIPCGCIKCNVMFGSDAVTSNRMWSDKWIDF